MRVWEVRRESETDSLYRWQCQPRGPTIDWTVTAFQCKTTTIEMKVNVKWHHLHVYTTAMQQRFCLWVCNVFCTSVLRSTVFVLHAVVFHKCSSVSRIWILSLSLNCNVEAVACFSFEWLTTEFHLSIQASIFSFVHPTHVHRKAVMCPMELWAHGQGASPSQGTTGKIHINTLMTI